MYEQDDLTEWIMGTQNKTTGKYAGGLKKKLFESIWRGLSPSESAILQAHVQTFLLARARARFLEVSSRAAR